MSTAAQRETWTTRRGRGEVKGYLAKAMDGFFRYPENFSRQVLHVDPWEGAVKMLRAIAQPHARVVVRGCHASGKSHTAGSIILWALACGFKVISTSGRWEQLRREIWGEVRGQAEKMEWMGLKGLSFLGSELFQTSIELSPEVFAVGWSQTEETKFQGIHGKRVLFLVDEANNFPAGLRRAIDGSRAGGDVRELHLGNPATPTGPFYEASRSPLWTSIRLDAFDNPNLKFVRCEKAGVVGPGRIIELEEMTDEQLNRDPRPYLAGPRWVKEVLAEYGPESTTWRWKVRGEFPDQDVDALIMLSWLDAAACRPSLAKPDDDFEVGIDVAGPGEDEHVVAVRKGNHLHEVHHWKGGEMPGSAGDIREVLASKTVGVIRRLEPRPKVVRVDDIGEGAHLVTLLRMALPGVRVVGVNVATRCRLDTDRAKFSNNKALAYWRLRQRFQAGEISGLVDGKLREQLGALRYDEAGGRVRIESKDKMKARVQAGSPDRAEAVMLAFFPDARRGDDGVTFQDTEEDAAERSFDPNQYRKQARFA